MRSRLPNRSRQLIQLALTAALLAVTAPVPVRADEDHGDFTGPEREGPAPRPNNAEAEDPFASPFLNRGRAGVRPGPGGAAASAAAQGQLTPPAPPPPTDANGQIAMPPLFAKASAAFRDHVPVPPGRTFAATAAAQAQAQTVLSAAALVMATAAGGLSVPQGAPPGAIPPGDEKGLPPPEGPNGIPGWPEGPRIEAPRDPRLTAVMADLEQSAATIEVAQRMRKKEKDDRLAARKGANRLPARLLDKVHKDR